MEDKFRALAKLKHKFTVTCNMSLSTEDGGCLLSSKNSHELGLFSLNINVITLDTVPTYSEKQTHSKSKPHVNDKTSNVF